MAATLTEASPPCEGRCKAGGGIATTFDCFRTEDQIRSSAVSISDTCKCHGYFAIFSASSAGNGIFPTAGAGADEVDAAGETGRKSADPVIGATEREVIALCVDAATRL